MVGGRYLATFCSNCFGISRNQVAELVAAAVLVATSRVIHASRNRTHFSYDLYDEIASAGQTISATLADFHREGEHTSAVGSVILNSSSFATLRISAEDSRYAHAF